MKLKALLLALCTAGFAVSIAVAASPAAVEKGKPSTGTTATGTTSSGTTTGESGQGKGNGKGHEKARACKPSRKLLLRGEFVSAGAGGFALAVRKGNSGAKAFAGKQVTVLVDEKTHFHGKKRKLADLAAGDRLVVQGYACKADAAAGSMLARKVGVQGPKGDEQKDDDDRDETTTTETTGTTTGS